MLWDLGFRVEALLCRANFPSARMQSRTSVHEKSVKEEFSEVGRRGMHAIARTILKQPLEDSLQPYYAV